MSALVDLTGKVFGRLTVIGPYKRANNMTFWKCKCSCEAQTEKYILGRNLKGNTSSCGCLKREMHTKHDKHRSPVYKAWEHMKERCLNPCNKRFKHYGGRGVYIDPSWLDFSVFYADMGDPTPGHSLGRIDNNGPYSKENCRWETLLEQANNTQRTRYIELNGERKPLRQWARELGIPPKTLNERCRRNKSAEQVLNQNYTARKKKECLRGPGDG